MRQPPPETLGAVIIFGISSHVLVSSLPLASRAVSYFPAVSSCESRIVSLCCLPGISLCPVVTLCFQVMSLFTWLQ